MTKQIDWSVAAIVAAISCVIAWIVVSAAAHTGQALRCLPHQRVAIQTYHDGSKLVTCEWTEVLP